MSEIFSNYATINYQNSNNGTNTYETETDKSFIKISEPSVVILKTSNSTFFAPDDEIVYNLIISNNSLSPIFNITLSDSTSQFMSYVENSIKITYSNGVSYSLDDKSISDNISFNDNSSQFDLKITSLGANETIMVSFTSKVKDDISEIDSISTSANLSYSFNELSNSNKITICSNTHVLNKAFALINASITADKSTVSSGEYLSYTINIKNSGNVAASNVRITDRLPNNFKVKDVTTKIADLPYSISFNVDEDNVLTIPSKNDECGICIPANTDDNSILIEGTIV